MQRRAGPSRWPTWIGAHTRAFAALGGVPKLLVPDNTKVAVIKACLYEPQVNRTYAEMPAHYDTAILPARPRRPHDKAKVEVAVLIIERWLLGRPRDCRFYSLAELNATIGELLRQLNDERPIRRLGVTRRALFEELESSATENEIASERAVAKTTNVAVFTRKRPALQPFTSVCRASG